MPLAPPRAPRPRRDIFSCTLELQVSTTHTTAGALIGMALASYGSDAVVWSKHSDSFPYVK